MARVKLITTSTLAIYLNGERELCLEASSVRDLLNKLSEIFGNTFKQRVLDERGDLKSYVALYVNGKSIQFAEGLDTALKDGDEVLMLPAIGGGKLNANL